MASRRLLLRQRVRRLALRRQSFTESPARHRLYYGWVLMVALGVTTIISYGTTQYLFGVLVVPVSTTQHWSRA
ncbi:MAG: hypothetical protein ACJ795_00110, partial [Ktedonobacteraceae bacterium]